MKVLLFYTANARSLALETSMRIYSDAGHEVHLLTTCAPGALHAHVERFGVRAQGWSASERLGPLDHVVRGTRLAHHCRRHRIDVVISHLQEANLAAVVAERLTRTRFHVTRHHGVASARRERHSDQIIGRLARSIVVLSESARRLVLAEGVSAARVRVAPLVYDFDEYEPRTEFVAAIKREHACELLGVMVGRLVPGKRHALAFDALSILVRRGLDVRLVVVGDGPERETLERHVADGPLRGRVTFAGFRTNVVDYLEAADILIHPSCAEVSANVLKEAGARARLVLACRGVGDADEYLRHMENAILIDVESPASAIASELERILLNPPHYSTMGEKLRRQVVERFGCSGTNVATTLGLLVASPSAR